MRLIGQLLGAALIGLVYALVLPIYGMFQILKALLLLHGSRRIVLINVPWYIEA